MESLQGENRSAEYADAFRSVRAGKNLFLWVVGAIILIQLAAFVLVEFVKVLEPLNQPGPWRRTLMWVLPATRFLGPAAGMMLILMLLFAVKLSLIGRLGGAAGLIGALLWSVILLAALAPWKRMFGGTLACGALYNLSDLDGWIARVRPAAGSKAPGALTWILYYARFIGYPVVALAVWVLVQAKFAGGYKKMNIPPVVEASVQPAPTPTPEA